MKSKKTLISSAPLLLAAALAPAASAASTAIDLTPSGVQQKDVPAVFGGTGVVTDLDGTEGRGVYQPTGTGVFKPFLSLDSNGQQSTGSSSVEQAFNTDGFTALYLDEHRPQWNNRVKLSDLGEVTVTGKSGTFYAFVLDSNEPGGSKNNISIDNVRIYTGADNTSAVGNDITKLDDLGELRWAMNNAAVNKNNNLINLDGPNGQANIDNYILLDSAQENVLSNSNGGSGKGDMILFVPTAAFAQANKATDFLWFYNLNGKSAEANSDGDGAAQAGYEEWKYLSGTVSVPDGGATAILLGLGALGVAASFRKRA